MKWNKILVLLFLVLALNTFGQKARLVIPKGHEDAVTATSISNNQKFMATAAKATIIVWDISKEKELYRIEAKNLSTTDKIYRLDFTDNDKTIIVNSNYAYNIVTGEQIREFDQNTIKQTSPDGKYYLQTSENYPDITITIFDAKNDKKLNSTTLPKNNYSGSKWNGNEILLFGPSNWVLFDFLKNEKRDFSLQGKSYDITAVDFPSNRIAFTERLRDVVDLYDIKTGKIIKSKKTSGNFYNIFFKEGKLITFQSELSPQKKEAHFISQYDKDGNFLKKTENILESDGIFFAENVFDFSNNRTAFNDGSKLKVYDEKENNIRYAFPDKIANYHSFLYPKIINQQHFNDTTFNVGVSASGNKGSGNIVFDKDNFRPKFYYDISGKLIYTRDGKYAAGITSDKITVADNRTGKIIKEVKFPSQVEYINSTSTFFNETGSKIYIANYFDHHIAEVDVSKGTLSKIITLEEEFFGAPAYTNDGKYIAGVVFNKKNENFKIVIDISQRKVISKTKVQYDDRNYYFLGNTSFYVSESRTDTKCYVHDATDEKYLRIIEKGKNDYGYIGFDEFNKLLAFQNITYEGPFIEFYNLNAKLVKKIPFDNGYTTARVNFNDKGTIMYVPKDDKGIQVRDTKNGEILGTYYFVEKSNEFVFVSPEGLFDGSPEAAKELYLVKNYKHYNLDKFFEKFYTPNLLLRKKNGEKFSAPDIDNLLKDINVKIFYAGVKRNIENEDGKPSYTNTSGIAEITVSATAPDDKVDEIRLFHNGKAVNLATRGLFVTDADGTDTKKYTINLLPGQNNFRAIALNSQRTESEPDEIIVAYNKGGGNAPAPVKPADDNKAVVDEIDRNATLHIVVVGINAYKGKINPLTYALPDATAFKAELEKDAKSVIGNVKSYLIADDNATKAGIVAAFENIKKSAKPEDVFVFYYAGHGYIHPSNKEFYLVSSDVADGGESLLKNGVSAKELQTFAVDIPAQKQLFIMDACQSAGAFEQMLKHDGEQQKALAVVSRSTGTHWMAASGSTETAKEFGELGHGVFTYSLLEALKGKAVNNKMITVNGLKNYLQVIVPELVKKYGGNSQYPASYGFGNDFPVEIMK